MKNLKKCFGLAGGRKSGLSFATLVICGIILLAVPLQISCSDSGDDNGDSTVGATLEGGADVGKNNSGEIKPSDGKDDSNSGETKPDGGKDDSNPDETRQNIDRQMILVPGRTYSILKTEVTQELYESVMGENPSEFNGEKNLPVEKVIWYDAVEFCNRLSKKAGLEPAYSINGSSVEWNRNASGYRLPTVEEWQYAAKGGQDYKYSGSGNLGEVGWYKDNSESKTHPVAQKVPNGYGLYDMSGNVAELCWDSISDRKYSYGCGGSWNYGADYCEVGSKDWYSANSTYFVLGFRVVRFTGK